MGDEGKVQARTVVVEGVAATSWPGRGCNCVYGRVQELGDAIEWLLSVVPKVDGAE